MTECDFRSVAALPPVLDVPYIVRGGASHWAVHQWAADGAFLQKLRAQSAGVVLDSKIITDIVSLGGRGPQSSDAMWAELDDGPDHSSPGPSTFHFNSRLATNLITSGAIDLPSVVASYEIPIASLGLDAQGLTFHTHGPTLLGLATGEKRWFVTRPQAMTEALLLASWNVSAWHASSSASRQHPDVLVCTQRAGDLVFLPALWYHATLNSGLTIGFGVQGMDTPVDLARVQAGSIPDLRGAGQYYSQSTGREHEGLALLLRAFYTAPSDMAVAVELLDALARLQGPHPEASAELLQTAVLHSLLEHMRGLTSKTSLVRMAVANLLARFGEHVESLARFPPATRWEWALRFLDAAIEVDVTLARAWRSSARVLEQLPSAQASDAARREAKRRHEEADRWEREAIRFRTRSTGGHDSQVPGPAKREEL